MNLYTILALRVDPDQVQGTKSIPYSQKTVINVRRGVNIFFYRYSEVNVSSFDDKKLWEIQSKQGY